MASALSHINSDICTSCFKRRASAPSSSPCLNLSMPAPVGMPHEFAFICAKLPKHSGASADLLIDAVFLARNVVVSALHRLLSPHLNGRPHNLRTVSCIRYPPRSGRYLRSKRAQLTRTSIDFFPINSYIQTDFIHMQNVEPP